MDICNRVLMIDIKTTGTPLIKRNIDGSYNYYDYKDNTKYDSSRIIQISWSYINAEIKDNINCHLVKPFNLDSIPKSCETLYNINYNDIDKGKSLYTILNKLGLRHAIMNSDYIIGHDIPFITSVLLNELHRRKFNKTINKLYDMVDNDQMICTENMCYRYVVSKKYTLIDLHKHFMKNEIIMNNNIHDSLFNIKLLIDICPHILNITNQHINAMSDEQNIIVNTINNNNNIIVDAVAGSGKTTTILHIANKYKNLKVLVLTFNSKLKIESREKVKKLKLTNIEIQTYHSFCVNHYDRNVIDDCKLYNLLYNSNGISKQFEYDLIIIDEIQDMTFLYYKLVMKIFNENNRGFKICLFGDKMQSIFTFNNSDNRFLTMGDKIFNHNNFEWVKLNLSVSFRITAPMANFINRCVLNEDRIISHKEGANVRYIVCNIFKNYPFLEVKKYLKKYNYSDIFILAPSVKSETSPIRMLANRLTRENIPLYVPTSDSEKIDNDIIKGKLVISSFHQVKGLERKVVIVYNFDSSYFTYYKKDAICSKCDDALYVALTRASEKMSVIHHHENDYFRFINIDKLKKETEFIKYDNIALSHTIEKKDKPIIVSQLTQHISSNLLTGIINRLDIKIIKNASEIINIPIKIKEGDLYESVSEITGTAIPSLYEYFKTKNISLLSNLKNNSSMISEFKKFYTDYKYYDDAGKSDIIKKHLHLSNYYCSEMCGYKYKLNQIMNYDWLHIDELNQAFQRLDTIFPTSDIEFEKLVEFNCNDHIHKKNKPKYITDLIKILESEKKHIRGSIDCITSDSMYELKTVTGLKNEHIVQLVIYGFLYNNGAINDYDNISNSLKYKLYNILTDEMIEITYNFELFANILLDLIKSQFAQNMVIPDDIFLKRCMDISRPQIKKDLLRPQIKKDIPNPQPKKENIIFVDIETSENIKLGHNNHIIQIAYDIYTLDLKFIKRENIIINNNITLVDYYHKFTLGYIIDNGVTPSIALDKLIKDMKTCKYVVAHNINFDMSCIRNYFMTYNKHHDPIIEICTMNQSKRIVNVKDKIGRLKNPKLDEMYEFLFNEKADASKQHDGSYDVEIMVLSFKKMIKDNMLKFEGITMHD